MTVSTTPFSALAASTTPAGAIASSNSSSSASSIGAPAPTESMFLQLLVAQLKYQDPTSPQDPTQFVGELAQFSQLEQTIGIKTDADSIAQDLTPGAAGSTPPSTSNATPAS